MCSYSPVCKGITSQKNPESLVNKDTLFQFAVAYRLGLPVNLSKNVCSMPNCSQSVDKYGDHALSCGYGGDRIYRHNALRDSIFHLLRKVGFDA